MEKDKLLMVAALAGLMAGFSSPNVLAREGFVECAGVAPSGSNGCAANAHACSGYARTDYDSQEWVYVQEGGCEKVKRIMQDPVMRKYVKEVSVNAFRWWRRAPIPEYPTVD